MDDKKALADGANAMLYIETEGWKLVREIFNEKILDLQSIKNLIGTKPEDLLADIKARNTAIDILMEIVKAIEGKAEQYKNNRLPDESKNDIIVRT